MTVDLRSQMKFGLFLPPLHAPTQNPTLALQRDMELVEWLDHLGYDEAWFGEHHSTGYEIEGCPDICIAAAAARTERIKLGSGVVSLPYHHPLIVADRFLYLDHLTRGRVMLGMGPGSFAHDANMMGLDYQRARERMAQAVEAIHLLLTSEEPVSYVTDWFVLDNARLNLSPYTRPCFELVMASVMSPSGSKLAGRYGGGLLSLAANSPKGFDALRGTWDVVEEQAELYGQQVDRSGWRIVSIMHLADTEEEARRQMRFGLVDLMRYLNASVPLLPFEADLDDIDGTIDRINESGFGVIGTYDRMVDSIERFQEQTGGFGTFLSFGHEAADREATMKSYEIFMRHVAPRFQGTTVRPELEFQRLEASEKSGARQSEEAWKRAQELYEKEKADAGIA